jgi:hypothetical protein
MLYLWEGPSCPPLSRLLREVEDTHAATSMGKVEELDEYEYDDDEVAYAAVRKIVSKANKRAFKDGKLTTGNLHAGVVGLDTCASNHLFGSLACIDHVRGCTPLDFLGIGGRERITEIGDHDVWGTVYIRSGDSSVNLLSLSMLESTPGIRISYSQEEGVFRVVDTQGRTHVFSKRGGKLYVCDDGDFNEEQAYATVHAIETVEQNKELFSVKEVEAADRVKVLSAAMAFPSRQTLHELVRQGKMDFTHQDIERADAADNQVLRPRGG